ncbi:hypothetical protein HDU76_011740, partial [Blyttiomyces sp. JEL0837]
MDGGRGGFSDGIYSGDEVRDLSSNGEDAGAGGVMNVVRVPVKVKEPMVEECENRTPTNTWIHNQTSPFRQQTQPQHQIPLNDVDNNNVNIIINGPEPDLSRKDSITSISTITSTTNKITSDSASQFSDGVASESTITPGISGINGGSGSANTSAATSVVGTPVAAVVGHSGSNVGLNAGVVGDPTRVIDVEPSNARSSSSLLFGRPPLFNWPASEKDDDDDEDFVYDGSPERYQHQSSRTLKHTRDYAAPHSALTPLHSATSDTSSDSGRRNRSSYNNHRVHHSASAGSMASLVAIANGGPQLNVNSSSAAALSVSVKSTSTSSTGS